MKLSFDSEQNISDVKEDIELFGKDFKVYAVYAFQIVDGQEFEYISGYVDAEEPTRDELDHVMYDEEGEADFQQILKDYKDNLKSLDETKHELMTLSELLEKLEEQNSAM